VPAPKVRNLGQYGVITDVDPYDLPTQAFSFAQNVRFRNNKISNSPVWKYAKRLVTTDPRYVFAAQTITGQDYVFTGYQNGRVYRYQNGTETDYSVLSYTNNPSEGTWTSTFLGDMIYVNRQDRAPWVMGESQTQFQVLPNWNAAWTCKLLRSVGGCLVALNVTKGGITTQTMVKTSSFALAGSPPGSWDQTIAGSNATENILADLQGPIMDACTLGADLVIYGLDSAWRMTADYGGAVWDYIKLPFQKGALNANCSVEINSQNYVFGPNDIWVHDGVTERSICDGMVREFIYSSINMSKANRCFVSHNQQLNELAFCFVSGDGYAPFLVQGTVPDGCNRSAVYNYASKTWTCDALPLVYASARANMDSSMTYTTATIEYVQVSGSYQDQGDTAKRVSVYVGNTSSQYSLTSSLYAYDLYGGDGNVSFPVDTNASTSPYLERVGIDLDELGADLEGTKQVNYIIPQGRIDPASTATIDFSVGSGDQYNDTPIYNDWMGYDGDELYKIDCYVAGKYLAMRIRFNDYRPFTLSGYDLDLRVTATKN
jgi:hypothetical protein